ncbi:MAG: protein kinase [Myxococcales bacterium]|nr:protein kinase [Myxococcales bacterium]
MGGDDAFGLVGHEIDQLRFDEVVDHGGFGIVYRGHHLGLDEPVAIKCLRLAQPLEPALAAQFRERFRDETKIAYRLSQGNLDIVRSISSGTLRAPKTGGLVPYMVLEWLEGQTLHAELKERVARGDAAMSLDTAVNLLDSAVTAVAYAHEQGVVHRDLKPGNLFLAQTRSGPRLKVLDFGLAKITNSDQMFGPGVETASGLFIASPSYAAPEQFERRYGEIGPWTDVYALALIMLEMMTGKKVRHAKNVADALMLVATPAAEPQAAALGLALPPGVEAVLHRAVSREARHRPRDAAEFWGALRDGMLAVADLHATLMNDRLPAADLLKQALERASAAPAAAHSPPAPIPAAGAGLLPDPGHALPLGSTAAVPTPRMPAPVAPAERFDPTSPVGSPAAGAVPPAPGTSPMLPQGNLGYTLPLDGANPQIVAAMQEVLAAAQTKRHPSGASMAAVRPDASGARPSGAPDGRASPAAPAPMVPRSLVDTGPQVRPRPSTPGRAPAKGGSALLFLIPVVLFLLAAGATTLWYTRARGR